MEEVKSTRGRKKKEVSDEFGTEYVVTIGMARVRKEPKPLGLIVRNVMHGETVKVIDTKGEWAKVKDGYMKLSMLNAVENKKTEQVKETPTESKVAVDEISE